MSSLINTDNTVVLITGANTGIGYATAQALLTAPKKSNYTILITSRSLSKSKEAAAKLQQDPNFKQAFDEGSEIVPIELDIDDDGAAEKVRQTIEESYGRLDVLVNNAGVQHDGALGGGRMTQREAFNKSYNTNVTSTHVFTELLAPLLFKSSTPRILFVSSGVGSMEEQYTLPIAINNPPEAGWPKKPHFNITSYRMTKSAMNMMVLEWIRLLKNDPVKIHLIDPGLNATNLGGSTPDQLRQIGAQEPIVAGLFIKSVIEGARDNDQGRMIRKDGIVRW